MYANSVDADQMPHSAASDLGLHCLPRFHLWDAWYIWVKVGLTKSVSPLLFECQHCSAHGVILQSDLNYWYSLIYPTRTYPIIEPPVTKPTKWLCTQRRQSAWASAQSDQSLRCPHEESLGPYLSIKRTAKTLIRLGRRPGWLSFRWANSHFVGFVTRRLNFVCLNLQSSVTDLEGVQGGGGGALLEFTFESKLVHFQSFFIALLQRLNYSFNVTLFLSPAVTLWVGPVSVVKVFFGDGVPTMWSKLW